MKAIWLVNIFMEVPIIQVHVVQCSQGWLDLYLSEHVWRDEDFKQSIKITTKQQVDVRRLTASALGEVM